MYGVLKRPSRILGQNIGFETRSFDGLYLRVEPNPAAQFRFARQVRETAGLLPGHRDPIFLNVYRRSPRTQSYRVLQTPMQQIRR